MRKEGMLEARSLQRGGRFEGMSQAVLQLPTPLPFLKPTFKPSVLREKARADICYMPAACCYYRHKNIITFRGPCVCQALC